MNARLRIVCLAATAVGCLAPGQASAEPPTQFVTFEARVPAAAEIWFDGTKTGQTGADRRFVSPPLRTDLQYTYEVRVRTGDLDVTRRVAVHGGDFLRLDLTGQTLAWVREAPAATPLNSVVGPTTASPTDVDAPAVPDSSPFDRWVPDMSDPFNWRFQKS